MATFRGDQLDECIELDITPAPGQEPAALKMVNDFMTEGKDGAVQKLSIAKRCPEQFPDRTVLATCSMVDRPGTAGKVTIRDRYYSADTARDSDGYMKDCLSAHGDWQPNTDKWAVHHERVRGQMKQMQKIAQDLESEAR